MCPSYEWEEDDEPPRPLPRPASAAAQPAGEAVAAGIALGRLDRGWASAAAPVRAAWLRGVLDREAAASAALEGWRVPAGELMAAGFDCQIAPSRDLRLVQRGRALLEAVARRSPRQLYTPLRLAALARRSEALRPPGWDQPVLDETAAAALRAALSAEPEWRALDPVSGMAALLADWRDAGAAFSIGGVAGRALAARWPARTGAAVLPLVPVALGFRARPGDFAPWRADWPQRFAAALGAGLGEALSLLDALEADRAALLAWAALRRKAGSWSAAIDALHEAGALSARTAAGRLGVTPRAASDTLTALAATPYVREISGRASWRVYAPRALAG